MTRTDYFDADDRDASFRAQRIANFFHCTADNIGDLMCGSAQYLWPERSLNLPLAPHPSPVACAIIGGGQIFSQLNATLLSIYDQNPLAKVIAWGVGLPPKGTKDRLVEQVAENFAAFGTRNFDRKDQLTFVPCPSCLSPAFDRVDSPHHEIVVYIHKKKGGGVNLPEGVPTMTNSARPPQEAIDFIASGDTIVTSSYHGVYWAQLLGRKVVCLPYNNKFDTFQYAPTMADSNSWQDYVKSARRTVPLLEEYRALNRDFALKATAVWNG